MRRVSAICINVDLFFPLLGENLVAYRGAAGKKEGERKHTFFGNFLFDFVQSRNVSAR